MMKEENQIANVESEVNLKTNENTGLAIGASFTAESGFEYMVGARMFGDLTIIEDVAQGTAVTYLCGVRVFNKKEELIIDKKVEKGTHYSRENARKIVLNELLMMLKEATLKNGKSFDEVEARDLIDEKLKNAYFDISYKEIIDWAINIGVKIY